jgi:hypothetical protein
MYGRLLETIRVVFDEVDQLLMAKWEYTGMMHQLFVACKKAGAGPNGRAV